MRKCIDASPAREHANNYLGIPAWQRDAFVYRIVKTERLFRFLRTGENVLVKPALWEDPFENFILKSHFIRKGEPVVIGHRDYFCGQCWTLQGASDAVLYPFVSCVQVMTPRSSCPGGEYHSSPGRSTGCLLATLHEGQ